MAKRPDFVPEKLRVWMEAGKRHRLSPAHVQMARELGMNPKKLGKLTIIVRSLGKLHCPFLSNISISSGSAKGGRIKS